MAATVPRACPPRPAAPSQTGLPLPPTTPSGALAIPRTRPSAACSVSLRAPAARSWHGNSPAVGACVSGRRCQEKTCRLPASAEALPWQVWDLYTLHLERVVRVYTRLGVGQAGPWQARSAPGRARHPAAPEHTGLWFGWHWGASPLHEFPVQRVTGSSSGPHQREVVRLENRLTWRWGGDHTVGHGDAFLGCGGPSRGHHGRQSRCSLTPPSRVPCTCERRDAWWVQAHRLRPLLPPSCSELHLPGEEPEDAAHLCRDQQWHLPAGPQPAGRELSRLLCVPVPG